MTVSHAHTGKAVPSGPKLVEGFDRGKPLNSADRPRGARGTGLPNMPAGVG
jgi:hypothetical protein